MGDPSPRARGAETESTVLSKLYLKTFGCQMNEYDSARMVESLRLTGYELVDAPQGADVMIFNSCSIREKAEQKLVSAVGQAARLKRRQPGAVLAVVGCTARLKAEYLTETVPEIDVLVGPDRYQELPALISRARHEKVRALALQSVEGYDFQQARPQPGEACPSAFVTIMKGCDNHCAYCVVPAARGPEVSREPAEVIDEVRRVVEAGAREVFLIGQNVNSYRGLQGGFPALLYAVADVEGVRRIRFTTSHPKDLGVELVDAMATIPQVCEWLHLPVQAGSSCVLRAMARGYTRSVYLDHIGLLRDRIPDLGITTDVIVGFPGERRADFEQTLELLEQVRYDALYSFRFSPREGTPAFDLPDDVPFEEKRRRLSELQALQARITRERLEAEVGRIREVLVEGPSRRGGGQLAGRSRRNHVINFMVLQGRDTPRPGDLVDVEVTAAGSHTLEGNLVTH